MTSLSATATASRLSQDLLGTPQKLLIDGKRVDAVSGRTFPTINPATGETLCQVAHGDAADVDLAVQAARRAFEDPAWRGMNANDRSLLLYRLADLIERDAHELAVL